VNVSDWFSSSPCATPANFGDLERVRAETWRQLAEHIPQLGMNGGPPPFIPDRAVSDAARQRELAKQARQPLTNNERLLVNVAGSWHRRPTAQTVFGNLVLAADYVRTFTDFASMEAANEAAKRAVNVILARDNLDGQPDGPGAGRRPDRAFPTLPEPFEYCAVRPLSVPAELAGSVKSVAAVDRLLMKAGFPHPLMMLAAPVGWFAGCEAYLRYRFAPPTMASGRPAERTHRRAHLRLFGHVGADVPPTDLGSPDDASPSDSRISTKA
jgi:hypothetical protein